MSSVAKAISDYLLTGMHHSTPEGQAEMTALIRERLQRAAKVERVARTCADYWFEEMRHDARAEMCDELSNSL